MACDFPQRSGDFDYELPYPRLRYFSRPVNIAEDNGKLTNLV